MAKSRTHNSELQRLRTEIKRLQKENNKLKNQLGRAEEEEPQELERRFQNYKKCPLCYKADLKIVHLPHKVLYICSLCNYRKSE